MLERFKARGLVKARGKQRTDSTHALAAVHDLHLLELVAETLRAALDDLAAVAPDRLRGVAEPVWFERYGRRVEDYRLPKAQAERAALALAIGADGFALLESLDASEAPSEARSVPMVGTLRAVWRVHYAREGDAPPRWRSGAELPPVGERLQSPYDPDVHDSTKRQMEWSGYTPEALGPPASLEAWQTQCSASSAAAHSLALVKHCSCSLRRLEARKGRCFVEPTVGTEGSCKRSVGWHYRAGEASIGCLAYETGGCRGKRTPHERKVSSFRRPEAGIAHASVPLELGKLLKCRREAVVADVMIERAAKDGHVLAALVHRQPAETIEERNASLRTRVSAEIVGPDELPAASGRVEHLRPYLAELDLVACTARFAE
jgi:hypothetical protein